MRSALMRSVVMSAAFTALASETAVAQSVGDPGAGQEVAAGFCASCHAVQPGEGTMSNPPPLPFEGNDPLAFEDIANTPGVTNMALLAWMNSSHPTMPDIILDDEDLGNVVAYILSLKRDR